MILQQVGEPITLIRGALENISTALDHSDLVRIAARLNLAHVGSLDPRETLLREIAMCISNGDGEFAESVVEAKSEEQSENLLAQDPIVAKVFEEADDEDKKEFDDMGKAMTRQKISSDRRKSMQIGRRNLGPKQKLRLRQRQLLQGRPGQLLQSLTQCRRRRYQYSLQVSDAILVHDAPSVPFQSQLGYFFEMCIGNLCLKCVFDIHF